VGSYNKTKITVIVVSSLLLLGLFLRFIWVPLSKALPKVYKEIDDCITFYRIDDLNYRANMASYIEKNHPKSIDYKTKFLLRSIKKYGQYDSITFRNFQDAYISYLILTPESKYRPESLDTLGINRMTYEESLSIIYKWRNLEKKLNRLYGRKYVDSLYQNYYGNKLNPYNIIDFKSLLPSSTLSYVDELFVHIKYNHLSDAQKCSETLFEIMETNGFKRTDIVFCELVSKIAQEIEYQGFLDYAQSFINTYYTVLKDRGDSVVKEKTETEMALMAWRSGDNKRLYETLSKASLLSSDNKGYEFYKSFYNINELVRQLVLLTRYFESEYDTEKAKEYLLITKSLLEDELICQDKDSLNNTTKAMFYSEYGIFAAQNNDFETAEKALELVPQFDSTWFFSNAVNLASIYIEDKKYDRAKVLMSECKEYIETTIVSPKLEKNIADIQLRLAIKDNDSKLGLDALQRKLRIIENDFFSNTISLSNQSRVNYWDKYYSFTLESITTDAFRVDKNNAGVAYNAAIFHKGILKRMQSIIQNHVEESKDELLKELYQDYRSALLTTSESIIQKEKALMTQYSMHPEFVETRSLVEWEQVQNALGDDEMAIEYSLVLDTTIVGNWYVSAIILNKHIPYPKIINLCPFSSLKELITETREANGYSIAYDTDDKGINKLYQMIWEPIESELKGIKTIYYSPYSIINIINLDALQKNIHSKSLFDIYNLVRISSTEEILQNEQTSISNAALFGDIDYDNSNNVIVGSNITGGDTISTTILGDVGYGNLRSLKDKWEPLYNTIDEIKGISSILSEKDIKVELFTKTNGSEEAFKSLSSQDISLIHLATHGFFFKESDAQKIDYFIKDKDNELIDAGVRSGLIFSGANRIWKDGIIKKEGEDGILTADEIIGMNLSKTDLLVLSTCQSALGDSERDGIYGIQ